MNKSMHRSGTMPFSLPKISKLNPLSSRYTTNRNSFSSSRVHSKSFKQDKTYYVQRLEEQIMDEKKYPYVESNNIKEQQIKLKEILKQFNNETMIILEKYIDKPITKEYVKKRRPIQSLRQVRVKQIENANQELAILKIQMNQLQARCQNLKYTSLEEFQQRIKEIKADKVQIIHQNKVLTRQITLNGLTLYKGKASMVKQLQYQHYLLDTKKHKLQSDMQESKKNIEQSERNISEISEKIQKFQEQESYTLKINEQNERNKSQQRLLQLFRAHKKTLDHKKVMLASSSFQLKHKYFQMLKQIEEKVSNQENNNKKIEQFDHKIQQTRKLITALQNKQIQVIEQTKKTKGLDQIKKNQSFVSKQAQKLENNSRINVVLQ